MFPSQTNANKPQSASTATIVRLKYLVDYSRPQNYLYHLANIPIWSVTETGVGISAGSLASLKPILRYIPFLSGSSRGGSSGRNGHSGSRFFDRQSRASRPPHGHDLDRLSPYVHYTAEFAGGKGKERLKKGSDGESEKHILKAVSITVEHEDADNPNSPKPTSSST